VCPNCGQPKKARCPHCGAVAVEKRNGLYGPKEITLVVLAGVLCFPIALLYYFDQQRYPYCSNCRRRAPSLK
jgi:hypothetical protein